MIFIYINIFFYRFTMFMTGMTAIHFHSLQQSTIFFTISEIFLVNNDFSPLISLTSMMFKLMAKNNEYSSKADLKYISASFSLSCNSFVPTSIKRILEASKCLLMHHSSPLGFFTIFFNNDFLNVLTELSISR